MYNKISQFCTTHKVAVLRYSLLLSDSFRDSGFLGLSLQHSGGMLAYHVQDSALCAPHHKSK